MKMKLKEIKNEFFEYCGMLTLDEIVANHKLIKIIERIERIILYLEQHKFGRGT